MDGRTDRNDDRPTDLYSVYSSCQEPRSGLVVGTVISDRTDAVDARKPSSRPVTTIDEKNMFYVFL